MVTIFLTILISFFVSSLFGYVVHWALHQSWSGKLNSSHMAHHLTLYPPDDYQSDAYRSAGKDNTVLIFGCLASPVVLSPIVLGILGILPLTLVIVAITVMALMSVSHNYLHDAFHIRNHFLTRLPLVKNMFASWSRLHYLHHVNMSSNYGIFIFTMDRLFGTFLSGQ
jgi:sterol desaturase/sphingolipid hydroxylase (fatty acid hydroxylase superfamily)